MQLECRDPPLLVTDPDAVVAFVRSLDEDGEVDDDAIHAAVAADIAANGAFRIGSATGLFSARKP